MAQPPLWTRDFLLVCLLNFLLVTVFYLLMVVAGLYAVAELGASAAEGGLVAGLFIVGGLGGRLVAGRWLDRVGRKASLVGGLLLAALAASAYLAVGDVASFAAVRALHGFGVGVAATAVATAVAHLVPVARSGEGIGYFATSSSLGTALGPWLGVALVARLGFSAVAALCAALSLVAVAVALPLRLPVAGAARERGIGPLLERRAVPACALVAVTALCYSGVLAFLGVHAAERGLTAAAGYFYLVYAGVLLLTRPPVGKLLDRRGPDPVFYPCLLFLALGLASLGFAREGWQLLAAAAAVALGFGNLMSAAQALAVRVVPRERVALATATFFIFLDTGLGFGPWLLGLLVPSVGYGGLYLLLSAVPLAALVLYGRLRRLLLAQWARRPQG